MPSVPFGKEMKLPNNLNEMATPRLGEPLGYEGSDSAADKLVLFVVHSTPTIASDGRPAGFEGL